jgi:hypothetical protein
VQQSAWRLETAAGRLGCGNRRWTRPVCTALRLEQRLHRPAGRQGMLRRCILRSWRDTVICGTPAHWSTPWPREKNHRAEPGLNQACAKGEAGEVGAAAAAGLVPDPV